MDDFRERFPRTYRAIEIGIARGLHTGAAVYISREGKTFANGGVGEARAEEGLTDDTILLWLSAGKPFAAVGIAQLMQKNRLGPHDPVAKHIPQFGVKGKEEITIRHLLTHTGGFRWADFLPSMEWRTIIERICAAPLEPRWVVGKTAGYHAFTSWYILAEIIQRVDPEGRTFEKYVADEIFGPVGMRDCCYSMTPEQYTAYGERIGQLHSSMQNDGSRQIKWDTPKQCMVCVPGASARGPVRELGRFYEMLLNGGKTASGASLLSAESVANFTARHREGMLDLTFKQTVDWGLGFIVNSSRYGEESVPYGFGPYAGEKAFGHGGSQSSIGMADPEHGVVIVVVFNGMPGEIAHHERMRGMLKAIYEDLGIGQPK